MMIRNGEPMPPVTVDQLAFHEALKLLKHAADMKSYMPVFSHVLIEASGDLAAATTTDLQVTMTCTLEGRGDGAYLIPIKQALALVEPEEKPKKGKKGQAQSTREVTLSVTAAEAARQTEEWKDAQKRYHEKLEKYEAAKAEADAKKITYVAGFGHVEPPMPPTVPNVKIKVETPDLNGTMQTLDVDDFPTRPRIDWSSTVEVDVERLIDPLEWAMLSVSTDEGRPHLNGLLWHPEDGLIATDGHRLHKTPCEYRGEEFLLSLRGCENLLRLLKSVKTGTLLVSVGARLETIEEERRIVGQPVKTETHESKLVWSRFDLAPWSLTCKGVDGRFPPWEKVVPRLEYDGWSHIVRLAPEKLAAAVRRVRKVWPDGSMRMVMMPEDNVVRITAENPDAAGVEIDVPVVFDRASFELLTDKEREQLIDGQFVAGFNPRYTLDAMLGMGDEVTMRFTGPVDACRLDGENGRTAVTMPMRL